MHRSLGDHPDYEQLLRRISTLMARATPLHQVVFRCSEPTYATKEDLLTGEGSRRHGGRWNAPLSFATVYAAFSDETALAEAKANHVYYGLDPADILPRTIVAVDTRLARVLDLTDGYRAQDPGRLGHPDAPRRLAQAESAWRRIAHSGHRSGGIHKRR